MRSSGGRRAQVSGAELPLAAGSGRLPTVPRPLLLVVCPEPAIARSLEHDLRRAFGAEGFEAACVDSERVALDSLATMRDSDRQLALLVADHALSDGTGVGLIASAR